MSKTLSAMHLIALKMHWGLFQNGERINLELSAFLPAFQGLNVPSPVLTLHIQPVRIVLKINATLTLAEWPENCSTEQPHHMLQLILASISCIWHPFFSLVHLIFYEFLHNEIQSSFFLLASLPPMQMDTNSCGKVGNFTSIFCFRNDSCQYVYNLLKDISVLEDLQVAIL